MGEWYCEHCNCVVDPKHVTWAERHDTREGGCGHVVGAIEEINSKDAQIATLTAKLERVREIAIKMEACGIGSIDAPEWLDEILREVGHEHT